MLAIVVAAQVAKLIPRPRFAVVGTVIALVALVLYDVTPRGVIDLPIGLVFGVGLGLAVPARRVTGRRFVVPVAVAILAVLVDARLGAAVVVAITAMNLARHRGAHDRVGRSSVAVVVAGSLLASGLVLWVGGNDPTVQWFGHVVTHGDRRERRVALTFDDGPDDPFSLKVSAILDSYETKGTFFEVGKAIDARPQIAKALFADGHLLGNHSYHHDYWRWLDPRYPELDRTQDAFRRQLGVCPAFFRPPHGQRTPFMLAHASSKGMHTVTWDVSAQDWSASDGKVVAQRILDHVQPGSVVLLHDGLDGNVDADRTVLLEALPIILDGLKAKGLEPVRLDELLGLPGYLERC
ncbi:MAG: peptidoglycan-N-acetylglucosamine deacetylase [Acidimicrobiaceae bacterium]